MMKGLEANGASKEWNKEDNFSVTIANYIIFTYIYFTYIHIYLFRINR